jgi:uncharacterized Zn-binding protein involved in type VI secretion
MVVNYKSIALVGDMATCTCGSKSCRGQGKIVATSPRNANVNGVLFAKAGDLVDTGCGSCFLLPSEHGVSLGVNVECSLNVGSGISFGNGVNINQASVASRTEAFSSPEKSTAYNDITSVPSNGNEPAQQVIQASNATQVKSDEICTHDDGALLVAEYIIREIKKNIESLTVKRIQYLLDHDGSREKEWRNLSSFEKADTPYPESDLISAMAVWTERVYAGRPWDHKPLIMNNPALKAVTVHRKVRTLTGVRIQRTFDHKAPKNSESYWHKYKQYDYYLDVWSNIHYGYVGLECGFTKEVLLNGADAAQFLDQLSISGDAPDDKTCVEIGFSLFEDYKDNIDKLTPHVILERLNAATLTESREIHLCFNKFKEEIKNSDF